VHRGTDEEADGRSGTITAGHRTVDQGAGGGGDLVKILMVSEDFPWPSLGGGLIRLGKMIEAVSEMGETDLFSLYDPSRTTPALPPSLDLRRLETVNYPDAPNPRWWRSWMLRRGTPKEVFMRSYDRTPRQQFGAFVSNDYDLVWFSTAATYSWMGRPRLGPTIVDLMDLEDVKARQLSSLLRLERSGGGAREAVYLKGRAAMNWKNAQDWKLFQRSVATEVDRVILCSDDDVRRSGIPNAVAVPNTYGRPERSLGRRDVGTPPTILFQGSLHYGPNIDGVDWLIDDVAPRLWEQIPGAQIRLVGTTSPSVEKRHRPPAVVVAGRVPDMEPELARADIAVVPLRIGSGTRLKILESFAHRIPVVSTTIGADGLDVQNGVHLLLADRPEEFARACRRVIEDRALARRLADAAERRFLERYEWSTAKNRIQELVRDVTESSAKRIIPKRDRVV
jgi:glycosyltransferase involved in cell wall biosynthesis